MCGINGFFSSSKAFDPELVIEDMNAALHYRGPDDTGLWLDQHEGVALGHQRLAIIDLSQAGHQPMASKSGRYILVYNGEIYNHQLLRSQLPKVQWQGHSDTETLLAGIEHWGLEHTLKKLKGMFAFGLWDRQQKQLSLARDRLGEKPLYYGWQQGDFIFSSELKPFKRHPSFEANIDRSVIGLQFNHSYIPAPHSIYQGIHKLMPASYLTIDIHRHSSQQLEAKAYWSFNDIVQSGQSAVMAGDEECLIAELDSKLKATIEGQMMSDVALGSFLSGGIDSTVITALMQQLSTSKVKTFTIGFNERQFNEATHAKAVAKHLGTEHTEFYLTANDILDVVPRLSEVYDEPFSDSSQLATLMVSQLTKQHVTVALSGDGGDELFGGYNRHRLIPRIWNKSEQQAPLTRKILSKLAHCLAHPALENAYLNVAQYGPKKLQIKHPSIKLKRLAAAYNAENIEDFYYAFVNNWHSSENPSLTAVSHSILDSEIWLDLADIEHKIMGLDTLTYLPNDILTKVDRAAMSVSLETRMPFLDHEIVEFAWQLPLSMKIRGGQGKWILRKLLDRYVPRQLVDRPKMGFGVPIDDWLRGDLKDWAESLLDESKLRNQGYLNTKLVRKIWSEHCSHSHNWQYHLWDILMFQAWLEAQ